MKINTSLEHVHPILVECIRTIESRVIVAHNAPFKLFETSRTHERHSMLIQRGKTRDVVSMHLFNMENDPPLYSTAVDYVFYDEKWSWNLRDSSIAAWYSLFGNLVLDACPELEWGGYNRKSVNFTHFELRQSVIFDNINEIPCVVK